MCLKLIELVGLFQESPALLHFGLQGLPVGHYCLLLCLQVFHLLLGAMGQHLLCREDQLLQLCTGGERTGLERERHGDPANIRKVLIWAIFSVHENTIQATFSDLTFLILKKPSIMSVVWSNSDIQCLSRLITTVIFQICFPFFTTPFIM